jgi:putative transcriptional regulator
LDGPASLAGHLLVASTRITEPTFSRSVVLVLEHGGDGAYGLVLNQPSTETVIEYLPEWANFVAEPGLIHIGGPVEPAVGTCLAPGSAGLPSPLPGVSLLDLADLPETAPIGIRIYSGYSGWAPDQLEGELAEGAWYVVDAAPDDPFANPSGLWAGVLRRQPGQVAMVANFPDDPSLN